VSPHQSFVKRLKKRPALWTAERLPHIYPGDREPGIEKLLKHPSFLSAGKSRLGRRIPDPRLGAGDGRHCGKNGEGTMTIQRKLDPVVSGDQGRLFSGDFE